MTLTASSQITKNDTTISLLNLKPKTITYYDTTYKAFTLEQTREIVKELATLEYLAWENDLRENWITDLEGTVADQNTMINLYKQKSSNYQSIISNQQNIIKNKDNIIHIHQNTIKRKNKIMILGTTVSIAAIVGILFVVK
ncbi:gp292 [Sphingomonas phage PAU]|uniref:gp292 n=1 Tax=Sphingomonas phage PAU TaxID=1150991 RepID=UPI00025734A3|nr:gp292 [Sphingomonas phage PAU]AFF28289.1 gp292 [Sphingomonas phage PAU]